MRMCYYVSEVAFWSGKVKAKAPELKFWKPNVLTSWNLKHAEKTF